MTSPQSVAGVVVLGSANADLVLAVDRIPAAGETLLSTQRADHPGGKGLNQAVASARAGSRTTLLAAVGTDEAGDRLLDAARAAGVDVTAVRRVAERTGTAIVLVAADGDNAIVVDAGANAQLTDLTAAETSLLAGARVVVAQLEVPLEGVVAGAQAALTATVVLNAAPAAPLPARLLDAVDVLVVNEHEAAVVAGRQASDGAEGVAKIDGLVEALLERVPAVVVTLGGAGAVLGRWTPAGPEVRRVPAPHVDVVDTTGAGDTCVGYLAAGLAEGLDLPDALARAIAAASLSTTRPGATTSVPTLAEVETEILRRQQGENGE